MFSENRPTVKHTIWLLLLCYLNPQISFSQWEVVDCGVGSKLDFVNDSTGFMLNIDSTTYLQHVLKTTDYGSSWDTVLTLNTMIGIQALDLSFPSDSVGYVSMGGAGYILKTMDGGQNWFEQNISEVWAVNTIEFQNELDGYGGSTDGYVSFVETHDGGENWAFNFDMGMRDVSIYNDCDVMLVSGGIYYSNESCVPWFSTIDNYDGGTFSSVESASSDTIFMGGLGWDGNVTFNYGIIARSVDNGETWGFIEYPYLGTVYDMQFFSSSVGYAVAPCLYGNPFVGYHTIFLKTIDGGDTWHYQEFFNETDNEVVAAHNISCPSETVCYATGSDGCLLRTLNGGGELFPMPVGIEENSMTGSTEVYPNPTQGLFWIESPSTISKIEVFNTLGQRCLSVAGKNTSSVYLDVSEFVNGFYILSIKTDSGSITKSLLKN